jgi:tetraacyldisaccharide 4'-kinase
MKSSASLLPLSAVYGVVTRTRLAAYRRGWFFTSKLPAPVISVGNLTTGGTGKTPLVEWVCRAAANVGADDSAPKRVCVLTRGYGRENPKTQVVVSNGTEILAGEREAGDEPLLLARNLLGIAAVICNPNRAAAGKWASEELNTEVFVLDDGFQHLRLARDLDIVTIDATNPWGGGDGGGGGSLLPHGRLREPVAGLSRADCVVITRTDQVEDLASIKKAVAESAGAIPIFSSRMVTAGIRRLSGESIDRGNLVAQPLAAFCGVGNPESFFEQLRREGFVPTLTRTFADHHRYNQSDADALAKEAKANGAEGLITTAKDAVKLSSFDFELPCYVLDIQIAIDDEDRLVEMIRKVQSPMSNVQCRT